MATFTIVYAERQYRQWTLNIEAESAEKVKELFEHVNEDVWHLADSAAYDTSWGMGKDDGEAVDTYDSQWHVEDEEGHEYPGTGREYIARR